MALQLFLIVWHACGALALVAVACGQLVRLSFGPRVTSCMQGLAFGAGALCSMLAPLDLGFVSVDGRTVFIGLAGAFVGLPGALICAGAVLAFRLYAPEFPPAGETIAVITPLCLGMLWSALVRPRWGANLISLAVLALCLSGTLLLVLVKYPSEVGIALLASCWPPIFVIALVSAQLYGILMGRELAQITRERLLAADASADPLTGALNRRAFTKRLEDLQSSGAGVCLLMVDADNFKDINDTYGHAAGDAWLVSFVQTATPILPRDALLARLGGEEFAVVLPDCTDALGEWTAEQLRREVQRLKVCHAGYTFGTTVSIGLARSRVPTDSTLLPRADLALYFAKSAGRNTAAEVLQDGTPVLLGRTSVVANTDPQAAWLPPPNAPSWRRTSVGGGARR